MLKHAKIDRKYVEQLFFSPSLFKSILTLCKRVLPCGIRNSFDCNLKTMIVWIGIWTVFKTNYGHGDQVRENQRREWNNIPLRSDGL